MSKILIIAEKPDMAKKISSALSTGHLSRKEGFSEDDNFIFTNAVGHLLRLAYPKEVDEKYTNWNIKVLPFEFDKIPLVVSESTKKQFVVVKKLLSRKDVSEIINACDSDREGEYIYRNIILGAKVKFASDTKFTRLWISSTTKEGIIEAFKNRKLSTEYNALGNSAKARSYADYHLGLNATIGMTSSFGRNKEMISVGRVQTPTLKIIVDREIEIQNFKSKKLYAIKGKFESGNKTNFIADFIPQFDEKNEFEDLKRVNDIISAIKKGPYKVIEKKVSERKSSHKNLFALSDLQMLMSSRYGYSAQEVLDTVQTLYEKHSLVTYPRTDEIHISPEWAKKCSSVVLESVSEVFGSFTREIQKNAYTLDSACIAKKDKIGAHEALTPTEKKLTKEAYASLSEKERRVYDAIVYRFLSIFYPEAIDEVVSYKFNNSEDTFKYSYTKEVDPGYRILEKKNEEETNDTIELDLKEGETVELLEAYAKEKETQPPKRFSEGSLIREMKNPVKYLESKEDKALIKSVEGIGTEATRASIIESLKKRNYIEIKNKHIIPTEKGMNFIKVFPSDTLKSVSLTVDLERKLEAIAENKYTFKEFMNEVYAMDKKLIEDIEKASKENNVSFQNSTYEEICKCPHCGGSIVEYKNCYSCRNKECNTVIFKDQLNKSLGLKKISKKQAIELLKKGKTSKKAKGFVSKSGHKYSAYITYSQNKEDKFPNKVWISFE